MAWMRIPCREAARLMSLQLDEPLGRWRTLGLKLHLRLCGDCREIESQLERIGSMSREAWADPPASADEAAQR